MRSRLGQNELGGHIPPANDRAPRFAVKQTYTTIITAASALEEEGNFFLFRLWPAAYFLFPAPNTPAL